MSWPFFVILAFVLLVLQEGLRALWQVGQASPSLLLVLLVFIATAAPSRTVMWAAVLLGLMVDLVTSWHLAGAGQAVLVGPTALGYVVGSYAVLQLRGVVFKRSAVSIVAMTCAAGVFAHLVVVALLTARGVSFLAGEPVVGWSYAGQIVARFGELVYSVLIAVPMCTVLGWFEPFLGFNTGARSRRSV